MFDLKSLENNGLIITPRECKKKLLKYTNKLDISLKFISKEELFRKCFFDYDDRAILYLINKGYSYSNAKEILSNLYFVEPKNEKLKFLSQIREELKQNDLIIEESFHIFNNRKVYLYHYSKHDEELISLLNKYHVSFGFLEDLKVDNLPQVNQYLDIEEEVDETLNHICYLIDKGVNINQIKLFNYPSEYDLVIKKYAKFYDLPINFKQDMSLYLSPYFKDFISLYETNSLVDAFNLIKDKIKIDRFGFILKLRQVINDIGQLFNDKEQEKKYLIDKAKEVKLLNIEYVNGIDIVDEHEISDDYIFILGFNLLNFPKVKKDISYLNDMDKSLINRNTSLKENLIDEEMLISFIHSHSNLSISYKLNIGKDVFYPSLLIEKLNLKVINNQKLLTRYSLKALKTKVSKEYDLFQNYGIKSKYLDSIDLNLLDYKTYNHDFVSFDQIKNDDRLQISYSKINLYNKCPFSYYIDHILKISNFETNFKIELGTFYHSILEEGAKKQIKFDEYLKKCDEIFENVRDRYFAKKLIEQVKFVDEFNHKLIENGEDLKVIPEENITICVDENTTLKGQVDKIIFSPLYQQLIIIDYKTGNDKFDKNKLDYGLSMQLPLYSILLENYFPDYYQVGIYIQNILNDARDSSKELRLRGITRYDRKALEHFDKSLVNPSTKSEFIYGVSIDKDDNLKVHDSLLDEEKWNEVVSKAKVKLQETISSIRKGDFKISPIRYNDEPLPCDHCLHNSICFKTKSDERIVVVKKESDQNG